MACSVSQNAPKRVVMVRRFPVSLLSDVIYSIRPMPLDLAQTIRTLRLEHGLRYEHIMWSLSESDPDPGQCLGFGKALTELAGRALSDDDPRWK
jgi:hypothetical protein